MNTNLSENKNSKKPIIETLLWRVLRWVPLLLMMIILLGLLAVYFIGGMPRIMAWYLFQFIPPIFGFVFLVVIVLYGLIQKKYNPLMIVTMVLSLVSLLPILLLVIKVPYPSSLEKTFPAATVRLPADVPLKVIWGGDNIKNNYHVFVPDQRWAYDLVVEPYLIGSNELSDYGCYGTPVLSPADGYISSIRENEPDMTPGVSSNNSLAPTGNYVSIKMESGTFLVIAHLKPGSILVQEGDTVLEGQQLGECGNSGNTSEPHIHIHHQRQDPAEFPVNFAEGLPLYFRDHDGPIMPLGGIKEEDGKIIATGDTIMHIGE